MTDRPQRWMTRDFVFTAPPSFPNVVARQPERFDLRPYPRDTELPSLFVLALDPDKPWELDESFAPLAMDLIGPNGPDEWSLTAVQVLGREGRYGIGTGSSAKGASDAAGVTLVRGRDDSVWAFGWRSAADERDTVERNYNVLMQSLQARTDRIGEKALRLQYERQERKRRVTIEAANSGQSDADTAPEPADDIWEHRFAAALGENDSSAVLQLFTDAVALVEEPYGEEAPLAASRIGGGPDLPRETMQSHRLMLRRAAPQPPPLPACRSRRQSDDRRRRAALHLTLDSRRAFARFTARHRRKTINLRIGGNVVASPHVVENRFMLRC